MPADRKDFIIQSSKRPAATELRVHFHTSLLDNGLIKITGMSDIEYPAPVEYEGFKKQQASNARCCEKIVDALEPILKDGSRSSIHLSETTPNRSVFHLTTTSGDVANINASIHQVMTTLHPPKLR